VPNWDGQGTLMSTSSPSALKERSYGIDAFRLLSALPVIAAHGGRYELFNPTVHEVVSLLSKWSVPFFFLVLGYFLGKKSDRNRAVPAMLRIAVMFTVASIILLPLDFYKDGVQVSILLISKNFLMSGTHFHLWFLSSLLMGLMVVRVTDEYEVKNLLPVCALGALFAAILFGTYWSPQTAHFGRHLIAIPFLWFGTLLSKRQPTMKQSVALLLLGFAVESLEAVVIHSRFHKEIGECPLLIGTIPFALGMFGVAANLKNTALLVYFGRLGGRFTGCIYVTHVYFIAIVASIAASLEVQGSFIYCVLVVPIVFLVTLSVLRLINYIAPSAIDVLLGDKDAISGLFTRKVVVPRPLI
jgi:surface polysaccharide O-acyltransferase-like enzyme